MNQSSKVLCVASRGRGENWAQHFEARTDGLTNTITSVAKDNYLLMIRFPGILAKQRSEQGKIIRRQYKNDIGVPYATCKMYSPRTDGICGTITTFTTDNNIIDLTYIETNMEYKPHPTKEDLLEYFAPRIRIRKMTETEALRIMGFCERTIYRIKNAIIRTVLKSGKVKKKKMPKTQIYKQAGNSIVPSCIYHIGRTLWIPDQSENRNQKHQIKQMSIFDMLD